MRTSLQLDRTVSRKLKILADYENRTKVDEIRFLVKKELENLNISSNLNQKIKSQRTRN